MNKERYFAPTCIRQKSLQMLAEVELFRMRHPLRLVPERSALLILDMQQYFTRESSHAFIPAASAVIPGIAKLYEVCSCRGLPTIFTRHCNSSADAGMMSRWWRDTITESTPASEIVPDFDRAGSTVIVKSQYDAFYQTQLEEILRQNGTTQVMICGVMTHLCCETTARSAFVRGFEVFFTIDGTATYNEAHHKATLLNLAHGFAVPVLIPEILAALGEPDAS